MAQTRLRSVVQGRGLFLLPVAAFAVHQLRYTLAYGSHANQVLAMQGHSYLNSLAPWLVLLAALGTGSFLLRVARALAAGGRQNPLRPFFELWSISTGSLAVIYVVQELLEGLFAVGHPAGFGGVFGHGGWWALMLAVVAGAAVASLLRVACAIVAAAERLTRRPLFGLPPLARRLQAVSLVPRSPLAGAAAGRAPPAA